MDGENSSAPASGNNKMMGAMTVFVVIALLVGVAAYAVRHQIRQMFSGQTTQVTTTENNPAPQPTSAQPASPEAPLANVVEVDYTTTGFSPASVTVKKGGTVKFINKSGGSMDVASDPHPAHTDYPGFDQYKSSSKGQAEYDFIFDKLGSWGYHNHLSPGDKGTVVVTD